MVLSASPFHSVRLIDKGSCPGRIVREWQSQDLDQVVSLLSVCMAPP